MDILIIAVLCILFMLFDFFPKRDQRSRTVNRCYLLLMFFSVSLLLINFCIPNAPKVVNLINLLFTES